MTGHHLLNALPDANENDTSDIVQLTRNMPGSYFALRHVVKKVKVRTPSSPSSTTRTHPCLRAIGISLRRSLPNTGATLHLARVVLARGLEPGDGLVNDGDLGVDAQQSLLEAVHVLVVRDAGHGGVLPAEYPAATS